MNKNSRITSKIHYVKPCDINIKCNGNIIMNNYASIDIVTTSKDLTAKNINIECNELIMSDKAMIKAMNTRDDVFVNDERSKMYGKINIKIYNKDRDKIINKLDMRCFKPVPIFIEINEMKTENQKQSSFG
eukprot:101612_1